MGYLLEVGELGDLHPVEPHLPPQPPRPQDWALPIILHKPHVHTLGVDTQNRQTAEIEFLGVTRVGFKDNLEGGGVEGE